MELFLPSLVLIIIAAFFVFLVIPRVSPTIIFLLCIFFLFTMVQAHYSMFKDEYKLNSWRDQLQVLAQPIIISIIVIGVIFASSQFLFGFNLTNLLDKAKNMFAPPKYSNISPSKLDELEKQL
jgi:hypothetical protein